MPFHHIAMATRDMKAVHRFYADVTGFELIKVEVGKTPTGGWAKHFFYDTGQGELVAFWELHDDELPSDFPTGLSRAAGLPDWVNHVAFAARDGEDLDARTRRWLAGGHDVLDIDHRWCRSIYTTDPNGTLVEFCVTTGEFGEEDRRFALRALESDELPVGEDPKSIVLHKAADYEG